MSLLCQEPSRRGENSLGSKPGLKARFTAWPWNKNSSETGASRRDWHDQNGAKAWSEIRGVPGH